MSTAQLLVEISSLAGDYSATTATIFPYLRSPASGQVHKLSFMPGPSSVCFVDSSVARDAPAEHSPAKDSKLVSKAEPTVEGIVLGMGGCESVNNSSLLDIDLGMSIKETLTGAQVEKGGADSFSLDGYDACGLDKSGVAGSELVLLPRDEPLVCEPLSCCSPSASSWVLQMVKVIQHVIGLSCVGFEGQFMALLTTIEASHNEEWNSNSKSAVRSARELKRIIVLYQL